MSCGPWKRQCENLIACRSCRRSKKWRKFLKPLLSKAIALGSKGVKQAFGVWCGRDTKCPLQCALDYGLSKASAKVKKRVEEVKPKSSDSEWRLKAIRLVCEVKLKDHICPHCFRDEENSLELVMHLNDSHGLSFSEIVDYLAKKGS